MDFGGFRGKCVNFGRGFAGGHLGRGYQERNGGGIRCSSGGGGRLRTFLGSVEGCGVVGVVNRKGKN